MFIRAKNRFETPSHNVHAGALVDIPDDQAREAIERGDAELVDVQRAVAEMSGTETATAEPGKTVAHATVNADVKTGHKSGGSKTPSWAK